MATFLVTGGAGFIGSHLVEALLARGDKVRVLDDLSTGRKANLPPGAELVVGDVADRNLVERAMAGADGCFHLAAIASVAKANEEWLPTHRTNLTGAIAVFDCAKKAKAGSPIPVVYASSAAVYGDNQDVPLGEGATTRPLTAYGADKLGCELHARVASVVHGVPTAGLRFFNVYGPRQDPKSPYSGVIAIFAGRLKARQTITINGDGLQTRDFIYVGDVVKHLIAALARASLTAEVYNVCTGRETTVLELARQIAATLGERAEIVHGPARAGDIRVSRGDPAKASASLGLRADIFLAEGLKPTLAWV